MAFLHNGNNQPTTTFSFYPCGNDSVNLEGLSEGESILSETPYFYQNANGYLAIDDRFVSLIITKNGNKLRTIALEWNHSCMENTLVAPVVQLDHKNSSEGLNVLMVVSVGVLTIILARRLFREPR